MGATPARPEGCVVWLTGLSGSGKSTLARALCEEMIQRGRRVENLDGDAIREIFPSTGFTREERDAHVKRVGFLASRLEFHGVTVVCSLISPYREARQAVRTLCRRFLEIHVATPIEECERRDPKGLYRRARRGEIAHFTGVDDPYESPDAPEMIIDTLQMPIEQCVDRIVGLVEAADLQAPMRAVRP